MKINKYLVVLGLSVGLTVGFTGCGGSDSSNDSKDGSTNTVGTLPSVTSSALAPANTTTAAALESFFDDEPDTRFEDLIDNLESLAYWEEDSFASPFSFTYQCETSGSIAFNGTYDSDYGIATLTAVASDCVGASYYMDEVDGTAYYALSENSATYEAKSDLTYDEGYYTAGTFSKGSSVVKTRNASTISTTTNVEFAGTDDSYYRVEDLHFNETVDENDDTTAIELTSGKIYVSDTTYVDYLSDTLSISSYGYPEGDVLFSAANSGVLTVSMSYYGSASVSVTTDSTVDDTTSGTATSLSDAVTVNGTLTTATDKMTYEATDFSGVGLTCSYVYIRVEDVNGSTDNPDTGLTADVNVTIYKDGVASITLDPSPGSAVGSLKAIDSSYNVISKITVEVEPKDNSADNVGTFTIKYSNPCN